jgi:lysophospholipase L1-like esterase
MTARKTFLLLFTAAAMALAQTHWVGTWGASPAPQLASAAEMYRSKLIFENQTLREIVHTSIGGDTVRVHLSNAYGGQMVKVGAVHIAVRATDSSIVPGSDRVLTFGGRKTVALSTNAPALSDAVKLQVPAGGDLAISIYLPEAAEGAGIHYSAQQTSYIGKGDMTAAESIADPETITSWVFLTGVDVLAPESASAVVAFGDSITDGARSTVNANHRWPDFLAERLRERGGAEVGVLDEGIGGNRVLRDPAENIQFGMNALARFDRDVLAQPGVKYVIVLEGINDLGHAGTSAPKSEMPAAEDLIVGLKQMIARAHERGLKIYGATLTPFAGTAFPGYYTPAKDAVRKEINEWIRTSKAFDGVIDFDKAVRDPNDPDQILPAYNGGDHLHPGDAGYKAMGAAIDLSLFQ